MKLSIAILAVLGTTLFVDPAESASFRALKKNEKKNDKKNKDSKDDQENSKDDQENVNFAGGKEKEIVIDSKPDLISIAASAGLCGGKQSWTIAANEDGWIIPPEAFRCEDSSECESCCCYSMYGVANGFCMSTGVYSAANPNYCLGINPPPTRSPTSTPTASPTSKPTFSPTTTKPTTKPTLSPTEMTTTTYTIEGDIVDLAVTVEKDQLETAGAGGGTVTVNESAPDIGEDAQEAANGDSEEAGEDAVVATPAEPAPAPAAPGSTADLIKELLAQEALAGDSEEAGEEPAPAPPAPVSTADLIKELLSLLGGTSTKPNNNEGD